MGETAEEDRTEANYKADFQLLYDRYVESYRLRDAKGCASIFSADAELYSPFGPPAIGRDSIEALHQDWVQEDGALKKSIRIVSAGGTDGVGWCVAIFSEGETVDGTSLNVLERQPDGGWLVTHCSLNEAT